MHNFIKRFFIRKSFDRFNSDKLNIMHIKKNKICNLCPIYIRYRQSANINPSFSDVKKYLKNEFSNPDNHILIASQDGKIVGFLHYCTEHSTLRPADRITLKAMFVDSEYRNQGIAKKLIAYIQEHLTVTEIRVKARRANAISSKMYINSGFYEDTEYMHLVYRPKNKI